MKIRGKIYIHGRGTYSIDGLLFTCDPLVNIGFTTRLKYLISLGRTIEAWIRDDQVLLGIKDR
jgi:hypothetical protein